MSNENKNNMANELETINGGLAFNHLNRLLDQIDHKFAVLRQLRIEAFKMMLDHNRVKFDEIIDETNTNLDEAKRLAMKFHIVKGFAMLSLTREETEYLNKKISVINENNHKRFNF